MDFREERIKRIFRARDKISYPQAICHITQHGAGKEPLFIEEADYLYMLHLIKEKSGKFKFEVFAFALMPNHLHLLMRLSEDNLSESMKTLFGEYATFFNKKYARKGHLFAGAYRQALCLDQTYFLAASIYIHLNPYKAGLTDDPCIYRWSSCNVYVQKNPKETFVNYKFILEILDSDIQRAKNSYREILIESQRLNIQRPWEEPGALKSFRDKILKAFPVARAAEKISLEEDLDVKIKELTEKGKLFNPESLKARKYLIEQFQARGYSVAEISKMLSLSRQAIYNTLKLKLQT